MSQLQTYSTVGSASIPLKQSNNNNKTEALMGMPLKPNNMMQGNMFSMFRKAYVKKSSVDKGFFDSSQYIHLKKINATGKSSTNVNISSDNTQLSTGQMSFNGVDQNSARDARKKARSGGCVAPKKKGAY